MTNIPSPLGQLPHADHSAEIAALRSAVQLLEADNAYLREQVASVATANAYAAELMVVLHEAQATLSAQNQRLQEQAAALATANAHAAELMVELHEAQQLLQEQNAQLELHNRFIRQ